MCLTLLDHKGSRNPVAVGVPFSALGEALPHTAYELHPLEHVEARTAGEAPEEQRRL